MASAGQQRGSASFRPTEHGFGFRNWSLRDQYFEGPPDPEPETVRERIRSEWSDKARSVLGLDPAQLPTTLVDALARQVRAAVIQRAGTNGHCYGMILSTQRYFERPETMPVDRPTASDIEVPTAPLDAPEAPVYDDIVTSQAEQYFRFRSWLGRQIAVYTADADTAQLLNHVRAVIEETGKASLFLFNDSQSGHQVLAYDYRTDGETVQIPVYDPNWSALAYQQRTPTLQFTRDGDTASMRPYRQYTNIVFNRYDQIEQATGRSDVGPLDHVQADQTTAREELFPTMVVTADTDAVNLTAVGPGGTELDRMTSEHMVRSRGRYPRLRRRHGATPGTYRLGVYGTDETEYELSVAVADPEGEIVDATQTASIGIDERHEYDLEVTAAGDGTLSRVRQSGSRPSVWTAAGAVGGAAIGALGYRTVSRRRDGNEGG
ncbi:hypothetical protein Harman_17440 [Haloarcula mannanilytica]|uniref:Uncharacterized protein n=1 Tax=Haloarcula mannanilytica TaxID=2509225 RepID=A0A4C2ENP4_9EURY|nr:hypothetical protein Harman_17440 [Haloarcula mannanilytica]